MSVSDGKITKCCLVQARKARVLDRNMTGECGGHRVPRQADGADDQAAAVFCRLDRVKPAARHLPSGTVD